VRWVRKHFPLHPQYVGRRMLVKIDGKTLITPLFIVLVAVETTDLFFAMDSIPAVFGVSQDSFIVYSSNVMAILGLRALYFALAGLMGMFHYLQVCLSIILVFIGAEMLLVNWVNISTPIELAVIAGLLTLSVGLSIAFPKKEDPAPEETTPETD
jgi:tellurite resistance protein TerC